MNVVFGIIMAGGWGCTIPIASIGIVLAPRLGDIIQILMRTIHIKHFRHQTQRFIEQRFYFLYVCFIWRTEQNPTRVFSSAVIFNAWVWTSWYSNSSGLVDATQHNSTRSSQWQHQQQKITKPFTQSLICS